MKRLVLFFVLSTMATAAMAQSTTPKPVEDPVVATASDADATIQPAAKDKASDRNCLKETGSRLAPRADSKGRKCVNATGRSYTKEDIDRTGAVDLRDAIRRLDPAVH